MVGDLILACSCLRLYLPQSDLREESLACSSSHSSAVAEADFDAAGLPIEEARDAGEISYPSRTYTAGALDDIWRKEGLIRARI